MRALKTTLIFLLCAGCAPKSVDSYHTAENEEEIVRLFNQHEYRKAVWLIESREGKKPADPKVAFLLGQAYLGCAGFEPLAFAAKVSGAQDFSSPDARELFPACPPAPLDSLRGTDPACLLKRVYLHFPDPDLEELRRARELLRSAYPDPSSTPEWVNVLIGGVETASVTARAGRIYLFAKRTGRQAAEPSDQELHLVAAHARRALPEAAQALARAGHAGRKISDFLTGHKDEPLFVQVKGAIDWSEKLGFRSLFDLLRGNFTSAEDESRHGRTLDRIRAILEEQEKRQAGT